jgi:hypothetical protein
MEKIEGQVADSQEFARQVLAWIIYIRRFLIILEFRYAFTVEIGESELGKENFPEMENTISVCADLITVDKENDIIRLVYYITQEYFERIWIFCFPDMQRDITTICIIYLFFDIFGTGFCQIKKFEV